MTLLASIRTRFLAAAACAGVALSLLTVTEGASQQRSAAPSVIGLWEQVGENGRVDGWFQFYERDGLIEGKIVRMFPQPGDRPNPICTKCPGDQKNQPTLGLVLIKGMQRQGRNFDNGTILDPRDGSVYQARMELSPDGQRLMVRGFLGIDLFGQSQVWRRLPDSAAAEITNGATSPATGSATPSTSSSGTAKR